MIEQDYVMRLINQLSAALSRILARKLAKDIAGAYRELDLAQANLLGIDREFGGNFAPGQLMGLFGSDLTVAVPKSYVLGVLLKEESDLRQMEEQAGESARLAMRALSLLVDTLRSGGKAVEAQHTVLIDELAERLHPYDLPRETLERLFWYQEQMGRFSKAEDALYEILILSPEFREEGLRERLAGHRQNAGRAAISM